MNNKFSSVSSSLEDNTTTAITADAAIKKKTSTKQIINKHLSSDVTLSNVPSLIKVEKEPTDDGINKEYAANDMSKLLSWYNYEKVDSRCTSNLNLRHFGSVINPENNCNYNSQQRKILKQQNIFQSHLIDADCLFNRQKKSSRSSPLTTLQLNPTRKIISPISNKESNVTHVSPSISLTTVPGSPAAFENRDSTSNTPDSSTAACSWCKRAGGTWEPGSAGLSCDISNISARFCSETCFAAGRRAAFKRAKTCNWCRHVRHSVSYVDFQDGESQLQFCSDKCLNQYKMNIFCRETQAHLALQGLAGLSSNNPSTSGGLITPELWLKDCQSPPPPLPPPQSQNFTDESLIVDDVPIIWSIANMKNNNQLKQISKDKGKQVISEQQLYNFEDTSNDTFIEETQEAIKESLKDAEKRKEYEYNETNNSKISIDGEVESDLSVANKQLNSSRECSKESSTDCSHEGTIYLKDVRKLLGKDIEKIRHHHSSNYRPRKRSKSPLRHSKPHTISKEITTERPILSDQKPIKFLPKTGNISEPLSTTMESPQSSHYFHDKLLTNPQTGFLPPITVLVPYPIPIPIPLPIPIPIPIPLFTKFFDSKNNNSYETKQDNSTDNNNAADTNNIDNSPIAPEDLSPRGKTKNLQRKNTPKQIQLLNTADNTNTITTLSDSSSSSSSSTSLSPTLPSLITCPPISTTNNTDMLPVLPITSKNINNRSLRKRRRQSNATNQATDMRLKRQNKFVPA